MSNSTILLAPVTLESLPKSTPNLMPFRIDYSGKAPISTYLRVEAASEVVGGPSVPKQRIPNADAKANGSEKEESQEMAVTKEQPAHSTQSPASRTLSKRVTDATTRFISSFRGRTIQGLKVNVPEGYVGVVLRGDGKASAQSRPEPKPVEKTRMKPKSRTTRRSARAAGAEILQEDEPIPIDEGLMDDEPAARTLVPTSQFSSFVVWHPDHPVDEAQDVYIRSLTEWTQLAAEIHRVIE